MVIVYTYLEEADRVVVLTIQDARGGTTAPSESRR
jgi:hypothetical protein